MPRPLVLSILLLLGLSLALPAEAQRRRRAPSENGEMLAQSCFGCHGPDGSSVAPVLPSIGGQNESYLDGALRAFREGTRPATLMTRLAKGYSDADIRAIAHYLSTVPYRRTAQAYDTDKATRGKVFYDRTCKRCHPANGRESSDPEYPLLAGQGLPYLQAALADIYAGRRPVDDKFAAKLGELKPEEAELVLHYFAAQGTDGPPRASQPTPGAGQAQADATAGGRP